MHLEICFSRAQQVTVIWSLQFKLFLKLKKTRFQLDILPLVKPKML